jgi:hypothetical protein
MNGVPLTENMLPELIAAACTLTSTLSPLGVGFFIFPYFNTSNDPYFVCRIAFMIISLNLLF